MKKYIVIHNLNSRGKNLSKDYIGKLLNEEDINFQYFATKSIDELDSIISKYNDGSKYQYCAVGGDGSLNSLVNSLMKNSVVKPEVACLPAGSGSDFVRTFALPQNIENAVKHLNSESYYEVDVGRVETKQNKKYFINVLNIGFLASTVKISERLPKIIRRFRYPISFWIKIIFAKEDNIPPHRKHKKTSSIGINIAL